MELGGLDLTWRVIRDRYRWHTNCSTSVMRFADGGGATAQNQFREAR